MLGVGNYVHKVDRSDGGDLRVVRPTFGDDARSDALVVCIISFIVYDRQLCNPPTAPQTSMHESIYICTE